MSWKSRGVGHESNTGKSDTIIAAEKLYCTICDSRPCFLLQTAALAVFSEQLTTPPEHKDLIAAVRYAQELEKLHHCLARHMEIAKEAWRLDEHFHVSEDALRELHLQGIDSVRLNTAIPRREREGQEN
jgi:hypothetical protein